MRKHVYIDTTTNNDFDAAVRFLSDKKILINSRNKMKGEICAWMSDAELKEFKTVNFEGVVLTGDKPLPA